ncbi:hypothetical protein HMPREF0765_2283 [Sphingobacterium spiritivorum ATCC 33300]|uniref:Uncharacterized protein n=1 Tax=Sphingobacterium spiritivorum ATCC 33300 TaxID=525372 RepID=C2FY77_SPHSI|nr:hypothetical protein HMPREF0765_2283 [Sphingobacterium spiritivorum ATCC 33300]
MILIKLFAGNSLLIFFRLVYVISFWFYSLQRIILGLQKTT